MTNSIMWCPIPDAQVVQNGQKFAQEAIKKQFPDFKEMVVFKGTNAFQNLICSLNPSFESSIIKTATIVVDYDHKNLLPTFARNNHMQLPVSKVPPPDIKRGIFYFLSIALMNIQEKWAEKHPGKAYFYDINGKDLFCPEKRRIDGFVLQKVKIALNAKGIPVSAEVDLLDVNDDDLHIRISDLSAFGLASEVREKLDTATVLDLYTMVQNNTNILSYNKTGNLICPCVDETFEIKDHLTGINWIGSESSHYPSGIEAKIINSHSSITLKMDEKGIQAHAETLALFKEVVLSGNPPADYILTIRTGLILEIFHREDVLLVAYVPQESFKGK